VETPVSASVDYKQRAIELWTADPCGPIADSAVGLLAARREYAPFMGGALDYEGAAGLDVLDVGCGQGIDLCEYAFAGARVTGVDLTPRHVELARRHLDELGLQGTVVQGDGEALPFADAAFDRVSSNGVLHHTPNMPAALSEIYRVLRPSGRATIIVYNRDSAHYWIEQVLRFGVLERQLLSERKMSNVLSTNVEYSSLRVRPLVRVYSRRILRRFLLDAGFTNVAVKPSPLRSADTFLTRHLPQPMQKALARLPLGWYLIARGERQ